MPVDPKILEACIAEAAGEDAEMVTFLRERYAKNDALAAKFVGGFMRQSDYTQKSQDLAKQRTQFEGASKQLETVRHALEAAETEKNQILQDLSKHRVSTAKARELMKILQDKYQLTDEDLPGMSDLIETAKTGKPVDNTEDIDSKLKSFGENLMAQMEKKFVGALTPELSAMANLPLIWNEIGREHEDLTGKRLSFAEQQEILKNARESNIPLRQAWEEKFQVGGDDGLRMKKRDERLKSQWAQERDAADADRRQKEALNVVAPAQQELGDGAGISRAFKTRFKTFEPDPNKPAG
ncbi:MAG TPA: hypothetical protein VJQ82_14685, partial [Terriglobales bacterium]|nr:hypothetical protein [Terriglobales bacterium]